MQISANTRKFLVFIKNAISVLRFEKLYLGNSVSISQLLTKFKPIKQRYQFLLFIVAWLICNEVLSRVLWDNLKNEVYEADSDSIGIPMMSNLFVGFIVGISCLIGLLLPKTKYLGLLSVASFGFGCLLTLGGVLFWMHPNHYIASLGHLVPLTVCSYMLWSAWSKRRLQVLT